MHLIWPRPDTEPLTDTALAAAYAGDRKVPHLRVNFVGSADGAVTVDGRSGPLSSEVDKRVFRVLRDDCDALVVGAGTARVEGYRQLRLPEPRRRARAARGLAPDPAMVLVSGRLDLDPAAPLFTDAPTRPIVLTHEGAPTSVRGALEPVADVLAFGADSVDLVSGMAALRQRGLIRLLCEGGPTLFGALLAAGLVDELCLTVSPLLTGAGAGRVIAGPRLPDPRRLRLAHALTAEENLLLRYVVTDETSD